ncbi:ribose-phosphate pyrophosphokinase [Candidatus Woesearchaeota archaeon]|nr:ribose-phosphate pyrophosphokinase [Candidatus Woesearchaeota archaeon]
MAGEDRSYVKLIAGTSVPQLAKEISKHVGIPLVKADIGKFPNGEGRVEILESVRGADVFVIQSTCPQVNDNVMELLLIMDALRRASANSINLMVPYFGYAKQDKKKTGREPISAKVVADLMENAGAARLVTIDLHAQQIEGFFNIPVDNLSAIYIFAEYFKGKGIKDTVVVTPDAGGTKRARDLANAMQAERIAIIDKYRPDWRKADAMNVIGKVEGMNAIIVDDFIDTGGSMVEAVKAVRNHKAEKIWVACTHPLLTNPATERLKALEDSGEVEGFVFTDTVPIPKHKMLKSYHTISTAPMLADTIERIARGFSLHPYKSNSNKKA